MKHNEVTHGDFRAVITREGSHKGATATITVYQGDRIRQIFSTSSKGAKAVALKHIRDEFRTARFLNKIKD